MLMEKTNLNEEIMNNLLMSIICKWFETNDKIYLDDLNKLIDSWKSKSYIQILNDKQ